MYQGPVDFSLPWVIPFAGIILSLALLPLVAPRFWHQHHRKVITGWTSGFLVALAMAEGIVPSFHMSISAFLHHYMPFMGLITLLFIAGGGIHIRMRGKASPLMNAGLLAGGALLANIIGTTGASMLLIRPLIALNRYRRYKTHLVIFFIFLVSNIGGVLTPLGDPPLFIGFLNGIDFFWTTWHLMAPLLVTGGGVLIIFWVIDHYFFYHDPAITDPTHMEGEAKVQIQGQHNLIFLGLSVAAILLESAWKFPCPVTLGGVEIEASGLARDAFLFLMAFASWKFTSPKIHEANHFTWAPLEEVALVFLGIFMTVMPVLSMLKAGEAGPLKMFFLAANPYNSPSPPLYFWLTGIFSSILDNAPTYLIFFNMAGGQPGYLMGTGAQVLTAISTGAVFMGALTYIGNAPNFMVRSIACQAHIPMPGFLGYMVWSFGILMPVFLGFSWFWFF